MGYLGKFGEEFMALSVDSVMIIAKNPKLYNELKTELRKVVHEYLEIDDYKVSAENVVEILTELLKDEKKNVFDGFLDTILLKGGKKTIFDGFIDAINPEKNGSATTYRVLCTILLKKLDYFHDFRREQIKLRVVK